MTADRCETVITDAHGAFRLGPPTTAQCTNRATLVVTVKGQGQMLMCDSCLRADIHKLDEKVPPAALAVFQVATLGEIGAQLAQLNVTLERLARAVEQVK